VVGQRITDVIVSDGRTDGENVRQLLAACEETDLDAGADRPTDAARHQRPHRVRDRRQGIARANDLAPAVARLRSGSAGRRARTERLGAVGWARAYRCAG